MERIKKSDVLKGTDKREDVETEHGLVTIRPLTDAEMSEIQESVYEGLSSNTIQEMPKLAKIMKNARDKGLDVADVDFEKHVNIDRADLMQFKRNEVRANRKAAAFAMSCDGQEWTEDEVGRMNPGVPMQIAIEVFKISGAEVPVEDVKGFRTKKRK